MKKLITTLSILFIATTGYAEAVSIQSEFPNKIVYSMDASTDISALKMDCAKRGGRFNSCGSMCDDSKPGMMCAAVCVNTCELAKTSEKKLTSSGNTYTVERVIDCNTIVVTTPKGKSEKVRLIGIDAPESSPNQKAKKDAERTEKDLDTITKMGKESTEFVRRFLKEGQVIGLWFDIQKRDKYDRLLAYVELPVWPPIPAENSICVDVLTEDHPICTSIIPLDGDYSNVEKIVYTKFVKTVKSLNLNALIIHAGYAQPMTIPPNVKHADVFKELYAEAREQERGLWKDKKKRISKPIGSPPQIADPYAHNDLNRDGNCDEEDILLFNRILDECEFHFTKSRQSTLMIRL